MTLLKYFLSLILAVGVGSYYLSCQEAFASEESATVPKAVIYKAAYMRIEAAVVEIPAGPNTAAYMKLTNVSQEDDKLLSVACTFAEHVELHDHLDEDGVMRSVQAIAIPAGQSIELVPDGKHIMFFNVRKDALQEGKTVILILEFEKAGMIEVECSVKSMVGEL